jgi:murein DD-endopeptidase MepM/ murein hydrolase activator NlpD
VKPERIDQGVDYAGSGMLVAIGDGKVTYVSRSGTGWPGSFIEYRLLDGPHTGCYVYYAEGVSPAAGLRVGHRVATGQPIARIIPGWSTGIELGWGAGVSTATYAAATHHWSATSDQNSVASAPGKSFSALISALGGPGGKVEG